MDTVSYAAAFLAGVLSFVSPCVLPLIPGYLSFISGRSLDELRGTPAEGVRREVLLASLAFVAGFSTVFVALGASASVIGEVLRTRLPLLGKVAGALIVVFGLHTMGVFRIRWLDVDRRVATRGRPVGWLGAFVVGLAFAFGWTPCIGPILGGILAIAGAQETVAEGVKLLAVYSAGLGLPFLATSVAVDRFFAASARVRRHSQAIEVTAGLLLVGIGVLIFTDRLSALARFLQSYLPTF
jgi:cytochrome c-type biogenesis protein